MARTIDVLADGFPHGTPAGYRDGCRGNGACPNRGTARMTCVEASQRYSRDLHYRRAYAAGDIWLDRDIPVDTEKEKQRTGFARRALGARGLDEQAITATLTPKPAPPSKPLTVQPVPTLDADVGSTSAATPAPELQAGTDLAEARREIDLLKAALAKAQLLADTAEELARLRAEEQAARAAAEDEVLRLNTELSGVRADATSARRSLAELVELTRRPNALAEVLRPPGISFDLVNGDLALTLHAHMQSTDVEQLRSYLGAAS